MSRVPFGNPATSAEDCRLQREGANQDGASTQWYFRSALFLQTAFHALPSLRGGPSAFRPRLAAGLAFRWSGAPATGLAGAARVKPTTQSFTPAQRSRRSPHLAPQAFCSPLNGKNLASRTNWKV